MGWIQTEDTFFFGNKEKTTQQMIEKLKMKFPNVQISGYICPEQMTAEELAIKFKEDFRSINADIVWVSLGFPKQEQFIERICDQVDTNTNFVGIGGVFDWVAGTKKKAPEWLANMGLEWLLRLCLLYTSPSPRDATLSRMPSSA